MNIMATDEELLQFADAEEDPLVLQSVLQQQHHQELLLRSSNGAPPFEREEDRTAAVSHKRPRDEEVTTQEKETTAAHAAAAPPAPSSPARLSKWAARLLDPHRARGLLVEPPAVIPLNDEFLQAFGRRERADDQARGITLEIDRRIDDNDDDDNDEEAANGDAQPLVTPKATTTTTTDGGMRKVKISNIKYTVTATELEAHCSRFGAIEKCYLPVSDEKNASLNQGYAYVTFEQAEAAQACMEQLTQIGGRVVNVTGTKAEASFSSKRNTNSSHKKSSVPRYWEATPELQQQQTDARLLSTKCYRCGETGHMAMDCASATPMIKPCPLCASLEHSEVRLCPARQICFQCGLPGHVARSCPAPPQAQRRRMICTVCFQTTHRKAQCNRSNNAAGALRPPSVAAAICLTCGNTGHFLCRPLQWFFGLEGVSCSNCGMPGHIGTFCSRPRLDACSNVNGQVAQQELERAATVSSVEESILAANRGRSNSNNNNNKQQQLNASRGRGGRVTFNGGQPQERGRRPAAEYRPQQQPQDQQPSTNYHDYRRTSSMPARDRREYASGNNNNNANYSNNHDRPKGRWGPKQSPQKRNGGR